MRLVKYRDRYAAEWREEGQRFRRSLGTGDKVEAQVRFDLFLKNRAATREAPVTVDQCWTGYRATLEGRPAHVTMGHEWKALEPFWSGKVVSLITERDCKAYARQRREKGRKDGTIWTELGRLRMALLWASKKDLIAKAAVEVEQHASATRSMRMRGLAQRSRASESLTAASGGAGPPVRRILDVVR